KYNKSHERIPVIILQAENKSQVVTGKGVIDVTLASALYINPVEITVEISINGNVVKQETITMGSSGR
ncbi:MAG: hypothetical protein K2K02_00710, partial [Ruminococcus sp.]|nr:hypothetical protein [Ruminococcus sp.]